MVFQRTSSGRAEASADGYVHSSTRSVSPGLSNNLAMRLHLYTHNPQMRQTVPRARKQDPQCPHPSVLPAWTSVDQSAYAGAYMRSVNSRMNFCKGTRPVAGPYCSAVARLSPPSPWRGSRGTWMRVELPLLEPEPEPEPKRRQSQPRGEVRCVVSGNASAGRTSAETEVKGKYSGLGRPAREVWCDNRRTERMIKTHHR
jgi:hypothetical protein